MTRDAQYRPVARHERTAVNSATQRVASLGELVAAWTAHRETHLGSGRGLSEGRWAGWLGANPALLPPEYRCAHWGDKTTCPMCPHCAVGGRVAGAPVESPWALTQSR